MAMGMRGMNRGFLTEEEKANRPKVTFALLKRIFSYLIPYWKQMILIFVFIILSSIMGLLPSVLTGRIIDEGLINRDMKMLITLILVSLGVTLGANLIRVGESCLNNWIAQHITFDMRNKMYSHLQRMSQKFFTSNNQGDIITRMTSDISGVERVVTSTFTSILSNTITLIIAIVIMFKENWILAGVGVLVIPLFTIPTRWAGKTRWELTQDAQECNDEINGILNETLSVSGQLLVKLFGKEEYEYNRYKNVNHKMIKLNIKESMAGRWFMVIINTFSSVGPMLLYLVGGILMMKYNSSLSVGDITILVALLGKMYGPVNSLLNIQVEWIRAMALFTRIFEYFDMPIEIKNKENPIIPKKVEGNIKAAELDVAGGLGVSEDIEAEKAYIKGGVSCGGLINAEELRVELSDSTGSKAESIGGSKIIIENYREKGIIERLFGRKSCDFVVSEYIEGDEIMIEHTSAKNVTGRYVMIGEGCKIGLLQYSESVEISPKAKVGRCEKIQ